jgi:hypothetical protein
MSAALATTSWFVPGSILKRPPALSVSDHAIVAPSAFVGCRKPTNGSPFSVTADVESERLVGV